jgi:hypothetical protein
MKRPNVRSAYTGMMVSVRAAMGSAASRLHASTYKWAWEELNLRPHAYQAATTKPVLLSSPVTEWPSAHDADYTRDAHLVSRRRTQRVHSKYNARRISLQAGAAREWFDPLPSARDRLTAAQFLDGYRVLA